MSIHLFKKIGVQFLCMSIYCFTIIVVAQDQDATVQVDIPAFEKSLEEKSFDQLLDAFYASKELDSTKAATIIGYLKRHFLNSKDENEVAGTYLTIATWQQKNDSLKLAMANLDIAIAKATKLNNKNLLYQAYNKKASYWFVNGENEKALDNFLPALEFAEQTNNLNRQIATSNNIILINIQAKNNLGAVALYLDNLKKIESSNNQAFKNTKLRIYQGLTKAYINLDKYEDAALYCNLGLEMSKQINSIAFQGYFRVFLGEIASNNGRYKEAHDLFNKAEELINKAGGDKIMDIFLKLYVGKTYALENKHKEAIDELLKGEQLLEGNDVSFLSIQELYVNLAKSYLALDNIQESTKYFEKAHDIYAKNEKARAIINSRITQVTYSKFKKQIDALQKKSEQTKYIYAIGITFLFFVIIGLILYNKKQQRKNKNLFNDLMLQLEEKRQQEKLRQQKLQQEKETSNLKETISEKREAIEEDVAQTETKVQLTEIDSKDAAILKKLTEFEQKEQFLSKESTLVEVAKKIHTNTTYLSKVINTHKEKSFTAYITDLRVDYAIERLSHDRKFRSFTIGAIAQEIGFKRSESFSKAFKVKTGLYPSYFIKEVEKQ
ncbi:helix-turn-helix domain-containing protein [Kordia sp. YSTF-M3]|uniref:Helix-turn-helix domain-containing protein n=1 Tax=Kordia aestuariivivens TaxID=2759037 RepID=A0ABR7QC85_9FLAO|nr:helix-turn-helix domain-containing protein [Kordia aestuariivivens]MBC8756008.1 helix-turn-helix domain-containing protein [Kordia aestuariivivens]